MNESKPRTLKELLAATSAYAVEDRTRSWVELTTTGAFTIGALVVASSPASLLIRIPVSLFASLLLVRCFVIYHDYEHGAILRDSRLAKPALWFFGLLILSPASIWNRLHNYHHSHNCQFATSGVGSFPVMTVSEYRLASSWSRFQYRLVRSPLMIVLAYVGVFLIGFCFRSIREEPRRHKDSVAAIVIHIMILAALSQYGWTTLFLGCVLPLVFAHAIGAYLFYAQHNFPGVRLQVREQWDYVYAAIYSSSFMDGNAFVHWFTANIGYHHVHHLNSRIPFYRLPEAMAAIPEFAATTKTFLTLREIRACLRLKLWDPQNARMVGYV